MSQAPSMLRAGQATRQVVKVFWVAQSTVSRLLQRYHVTNSMRDKKKPKKNKKKTNKQKKKKKKKKTVVVPWLQHDVRITSFVTWLSETDTSLPECCKVNWEPGVPKQINQNLLEAENLLEAGNLKSRRLAVRILLTKCHRSPEECRRQMH